MSNWVSEQRIPENSRISCISWQTFYDDHFPGGTCFVRPLMEVTAKELAVFCRWKVRTTLHNQLHNRLLCTVNSCQPQIFFPIFPRCDNITTLNALPSFVLLCAVWLVPC